MVSETSHCTSREDTCETNTETGHRGLRTPKSDKEAEAASSRFFLFFFLISILMSTRGHQKQPQSSRIQ